ncbi:MAG TPA: hypothetical protein VF584_01745 [Longimicrobium sp.]|jgi:hypothetical protein
MNREGPRPDDTIASPPRRRPGENPFAGLALLLAVAGAVPALRTVAWVLAGLSGALAIGYAVARAGAGRAQLGIALGVVVVTFLATPPPNRAAYRADVASADTAASEPAAEAAIDSDTPDAPRTESDDESPAPPRPRPAEPPAERIAVREPDRPRERPKPKAPPRTTPKPKAAPTASRTEPKSRSAPAASRTEPRAAPRTRPRATPRTEPRRTPTPPAEVATRSTRTTEPRASRTVPRRAPAPPAEAPARRTPEAPARRTPPPVAAPSARELSEVRADLAVAQVLKNQGAYYDAGATLRNAQRSVAALSARYPGSPAVSDLSQRVRTLAAENRRACFAEAAILRTRGEATSPCP